MAVINIPYADRGGRNGDVAPAPDPAPHGRAAQDPPLKNADGVAAQKSLANALREVAQAHLGRDGQALQANRRAPALQRDARALPNEVVNTAMDGRGARAAQGDGRPGGMFDFRGVGQQGMEARPAGGRAPAPATGQTWGQGAMGHGAALAPMQAAPAAPTVGPGYVAPQAGMPAADPVAAPATPSGYHGAQGPAQPPGGGFLASQGTLREDQVPVHQAQGYSEVVPTRGSAALGIGRAGGAVDSLAQSASGGLTAPASTTAGASPSLPEVRAALAGRGLPGHQAGAQPNALPATLATPATIRDGQAGSPSGAAAQPRATDVAAQQSAATAGNAAVRTAPGVASTASEARPATAPAANSAGPSTAAAGAAAGQGSVALPATRSDGNAVAPPPAATLAAPGLAGGEALRNSQGAEGEKGAAARLPQRLVGGFTEWVKEALGCETPPEHARYILMQLPVEVRELLQIDAAAALVDSPELLIALLDLVGNRHPTDDGGDALLRLFDHFVSRRPSPERVYSFFSSLTVDQVQYLVTHRFEVVSKLPGVPEWAFKSFHEIAEALGE